MERREKFGRSKCRCKDINKDAVMVTFWLCGIDLSGSEYNPPMGSIIQGEHKVFPWLQTFITRKLLGIKTYFLFTITW